MITNNETRNISGNSELQHELYTIDGPNTVKLFNQAIYSYTNPETSVLREYTVNGRDSMILAGATRPIEVSTPSSLSPKLTIRDFGAGLTEEETRQLLFSFGASGHEKQVSNKYVGGFGIGSKSGFNLSDSFLFVIFKDGTKTTWSCMLNKKGAPSAAKISSVKTDEPNGVLVEIPTTKYFPDDIVKNVTLKWLDVPVKLNGKLVESYKSGSKMSGTATIKSERDEELEIKWDVMSNTNNGFITFLVGCGMIEVQRYELPGEIREQISVPSYFNNKLVIELPVGAPSLLTSRESFIYDDFTKDLIAKAIMASVEGANDKIMEEIYTTHGTREMIDKLADLRKLYDSYGFSTIVGSCVKKIREKTNLEEFKNEICREIEISEKTGIDVMLASYPARNGRVYSDTFRYKTSNVVSGSFDGMFGFSGPHIWTATDMNLWKDGFIEEFSELARFGTDVGARSMIGPSLKHGDEKKDNDVKKVIIETLNWQAVEIHVYPRNTRKFVGQVREYVASFGKSCARNAKIIISLCGDVETIKSEVISKIPGAKTEYHMDVDVFKNMTRRGERKAPVILNRRKLWGWVVNFAPNGISLSTPEQIIQGLLRKNATQFVISNKTSFMDFEGSKLPLFYKNMEDADDRYNESNQNRMRMDVINLLLGGAPVLKNDSGIPIIALINQYDGYPKIGVPFVSAYDLEKQLGPIDEDIRDRHCMWMYRMLCGDLQASNWGSSTRDDASLYVSQTGMRTYDSTIGQLKCGARLLEYVVNELSGKHLSQQAKTDIENLKMLYTRPKKLPYMRDPGFSSDFMHLTSKFIVSYKNLLKHNPLVAAFMNYLAPYTGKKADLLVTAAKDIAMLIADKNRTSKHKENVDDNGK